MKAALRAVLYALAILALALAMIVLLRLGF